MAYSPTVWNTGDVITAEKLNKAEQGIAAAAGAVQWIDVDFEDEDLPLQSTWQEIYNLFTAKKLLYIYMNDMQYLIRSVADLSVLSEGFHVVASSLTDNGTINDLTWIAETASDYPKHVAS